MRQGSPASGHPCRPAHFGRVIPKGFMDSPEYEINEARNGGLFEVENGGLFGVW